VFTLQGKEHVETDAVIAGDIGAVAKIDDIHLGEVLHDEATPAAAHHRALPLPKPFFGLAVVPKTRGDEAKISTTLGKLAEEDPTFTFSHNAETNELVMYGLGELHLRLILERMKNRGIEVDTKPPKIAYRETIRGRADGHHRHKKQSGGAGQFGEVFLRVAPLERGQGFEFVDKTFGGSIPGQLMSAVEKGIHEIMERGIVAGFPVQDVRVEVYDGKTHPVDSKEIAFKTAGKYAFKDAFLKAQPALLEPVVMVEVTVPGDAVGAVTGDLSTRRARVAGTDMVPGGHVVVRATVPLAEMTGFGAALKSMSGGRGSFAMSFSHYDAAPAHVQKELAAAFTGDAPES
jgi:elongation factor G